MSFERYDKPWIVKQSICEQLRAESVEVLGQADMPLCTSVHRAQTPGPDECAAKSTCWYPGPHPEDRARHKRSRPWKIQAASHYRLLLAFQTVGDSHHQHWEHEP